jgi:hypothetical protein
MRGTDLSWVRAELATSYSALGRPSIDPVLMIRMLVVRYRLPGRLAKTEVFARRGAIERRSRCCSPISSAFCGSTACACEARAAQFEFTLAAIAQNLRRLAKLVARPPPVASVACFA